MAALQIRPTWRAAIRAAAAANAALGRDEAAAEWTRHWSETPALSADALQPLWRNNPQWDKAMRSLLQED
jgi:hypothetical protein